MRPMLLALVLADIVAFALATSLEPWFQAWAGSRAQSANVLQVALGDGRRLFARHIFVKADAYFHNGYYPSLYDNRQDYNQAHIVEGMHRSGNDDDQAEDFLGPPRDWIDAFGRHFFPARHTHLGDSGCGRSCCQRPKQDTTATTETHRGEEREILPWLRLSAQLDPNRIETYLVTAFWLRTALKKPDEAEQFLREGLRANPGNYEILFELGRIYHENRHDAERARNIWELALQKWREQQAGQPDPDIFLYAQVLGHLAKLEEEQQNYAKALELLQALQQVSPYKESVQKWIEGLKARQAP
jgi:tetratricopeptide (TPR) repeat protein